MTGANAFLKHPNRVRRNKNERPVMLTVFRIPHAAAMTLCVLVLGSTAASAASSRKIDTERGVIRSVDTTAHTLLLTEHTKGTEQIFQFNDQTKFRVHHKTVTASDLKPGERVTIRYTPGGAPPLLQGVYAGLFKPGWSRDGM